MRRNGHDSQGKQRWFCNSCGHSCSRRSRCNQGTRQNEEQEWFRLWVVEGYSVRQLEDQSEHSQRKLYRLINYHLQQKLPPATLDLGKYRHFILDGTFLHRPCSLIALMDAQTRTVIAGQYGVSENSEPQLLNFFKSMEPAGLCPHSFTVDGNPNVISVLRQLWPDVLVQRCLVHIQRQGLSWCRTSPRTTYARRLRQIFLQVTRIRSPADRDMFLGSVTDWENSYGSQISGRRETGYVFSDIKRARSMLLRALPDMFHYLDNPLIPTSTNGLEGYFSRLKSHYRQHRGLRNDKRGKYFQWYFHLVPK